MPKKPTTPRERTTLAQCLPGDVVVLAAPTVWGGAMLGRTLPAGATVKIAWQMRDEATFVEVAGYAGPLRDGRADEWCYSQPVSVSSSTKVSRVVLAVADKSPSLVDEVDPVLRGITSSLFDQKEPA